MKYQRKIKRLASFANGIDFSQDFTLVGGAPMKDTSPESMSVAENVLIDRETGRVRTRAGIRHLANAPASSRLVYARHLDGQNLILACFLDESLTPDNYRSYLYTPGAAITTEFAVVAALNDIRVYFALPVSTTVVYLTTTTGLHSFNPATGALTLVDAALGYGVLVEHNSRLWHLYAVMTASAPGLYTDFTNGFAVSLPTPGHAVKAACVIGDELFMMSGQANMIVSGYSEDSYRADNIQSDHYISGSGESMAVVSLSGVGRVALFRSTAGKIVALTRGGTIEVSQPVPLTGFGLEEAECPAAYSEDSGLYLLSNISNNGYESATAWCIHCSSPRGPHGWPTTKMLLPSYGTAPTYDHLISSIIPYRGKGVGYDDYRAAFIIWVKRTGGTTVWQPYLWYPTINTDTNQLFKDDAFAVSTKYTAFGTYMQVAARLSTVPVNLDSTSRKQWRRAIVRASTPAAGTTALELTHYRGRNTSASSTATTATASTEMTHDLVGESEYAMFTINLVSTAATSASAYDHSLELQDITIEAAETSP